MLFFNSHFDRLASVQEQRLPDNRASPTSEEPPITPTSGKVIKSSCFQSSRFLFFIFFFWFCFIPCIIPVRVRGISFIITVFQDP